MGYQIIRRYQFQCDDCGARGEYIDQGAARGDGWAISKDRAKSYCRECAESRRNVGRNGGKKIATIKSPTEAREAKINAMKTALKEAEKRGRKIFYARYAAKKS